MNWADLESLLRSRLDPLDQIGRGLSTRSDGDLNPDWPDRPATFRPAAVLAPIVKRPEGWTMIFTERSVETPAHPGQISFPGGRVQASDADAVATVEEVWHLAAVYDLATPQPIAHRVNVEGTRHVLDFCTARPELRRLHYVSTCYVSGRYTGIFREDDLEKGQAFNNFYEESKHLAEAAGLVLGAQVPVMLTSRADDARSRLVSCALAQLHDWWRAHGSTATAPLGRRRDPGLDCRQQPAEDAAHDPAPQFQRRPRHRQRPASLHRRQGAHGERAAGGQPRQGRANL